MTSRGQLGQQSSRSEVSALQLGIPKMTIHDHKSGVQLELKVWKRKWSSNCLLAPGHAEFTQVRDAIMEELGVTENQGWGASDQSRYWVGAGETGPFTDVHPTLQEGLGLCCAFRWQLGAGSVYLLLPWASILLLRNSVPRIYCTIQAVWDSWKHTPARCAVCEHTWKRPFGASEDSQTPPTVFGRKLAVLVPAPAHATVALQTPFLTPVHRAGFA